MNKQSKAVLNMLLVMLVWGSSFAVTKSAVVHIPPILFAFLRFGVASVILAIIYFREKNKITGKDKPPLPILFWMGLSGVGFFYLFFNYSLVYTSASMGALIQAFIPVIIAVLSVIFLGEKMTFLQIGGIILSTIGVACVALLSHSDERSPNPLLGNALMLISVFSWAVYTILSKKVATANILYVTYVSSIIGTLLLLPAVVIELWKHPFPLISLSGWTAVVYLGALGSALSYFLYNAALKDLPASFVGVFINLDPVIGAGIAVVFLKEQITPGQIAGTFLVLSGVWLSTIKQKGITQGITSNKKN